MSSDNKLAIPSPEEWESLNRHPAHLAARRRLEQLLKEAVEKLESPKMGHDDTQFYRGQVYAVRIALDQEETKQWLLK